MHIDVLMTVNIALCGKVCESYALMAVCQYINAYVLHNCSHGFQNSNGCELTHVCQKLHDMGTVM